MAAFLKHVLTNFNENLIKLPLISCKKVGTRYYGVKRHFKQKVNKVEMPAHRKLKSTEDSVATRGFLRCLKDYSPPSNVEKKINDLVVQVMGPSSVMGSLPQDADKRFQLFNLCFKDFNHSIPNSLLHTINSYDDLVNFYKTPINTTLPLDRFKEADLPPNLHIQYEPLRFHPDDDMKFNGQTAFPKSNTLVTGLRTKKKYKELKVVEGWPIE